MANLTLFAQIISQLPKGNIKKIIKKSGTAKYSKGYNTWSQFLSMVFCQFLGCDSIRDISNGLKSTTEDLNHWDSNNVFFVVRHKDNMRYSSIEERPLPKRQAQNVLIDEIIKFELPNAKTKYPKQLRRIAVWNEEHGYVVELLTNNFTIAASTIAALYKARWEIEIFFRNLKQLLRIKSFIGTSPNVVQTQIWTAMTTMLIFSWLKHIARYKWALANLVVSLRLNTFTKIDLFKWLNEPFTLPPDPLLLT